MIRTYEGIVIRQTMITGARRMILVFTREEGKLSAGTHISEKGKSGAALALRPFVYGQYSISEGRGETRTISAAEALDAHFGLGEDVDRFAAASFALEFTDKALPDGFRAAEIFDLLREVLNMLARRKADFRLLTVSYMIKVMQELGVFPDTASAAAGELLTGLNGDILDIIAFIERQPLKRMDGLTLESGKGKAVFDVIRGFACKNLDIGAMKSERIIRE